MTRRVKLGLAGLGSISQRGILPHLSLPDAQERIELAAVCDIVADRAAETATRYGVPQHFADYDQMIESADVEVVAIAGPIGIHYEQTMRALRAGKHVYVQKAMTTSLAEASDVVETSRRSGLKVVASPGQMLDRRHQRIRELIREGALGKVYWALSSNAGGGHENERFRTGGDVLSNVDPTWYYRRPGGGPLYDMTVYGLHSLTGILGPARRVTALSGIGQPIRHFKGQAIPVEMDDNTLILIDFGDATFAVATGQNCPSAPTIGFGRLVIMGTQGTIDMGRAVGGIEINLPERLAGTLGFERGSFKLPEGRDNPYITGRHQQMEEAHVYADIAHLAECILEDREPIPSAEHARHVVEIIECAYEAARTGQTQELTSTF